MKLHLAEKNTLLKPCFPRNALLLPKPLFIMLSLRFYFNEFQLFLCLKLKASYLYVLLVIDIVLLLVINKGRRLDSTLGALIKSDFAKKEILSEYMKIIDIIFCKLNIRNCIMHGLGETFDYLNIGIVAIMFQLLWDVAACEIFID